MPDLESASSESSSSESSPSRAGSPEPEENTSTAEEVHRGETEAEQLSEDSLDKSSATEAEEDKKPSLLESEGVHFSWPDPPDLIDGPNEEGSIASFDYVIVPGVYGSREDGAEAGPDSASSSWASDYVKKAGCSNRILKFEYTSQNLFSGPKCREAIRNSALQLLRGISALRKDVKRKRLITFVAFDLGGILVKDALIAASLDPGSWSDIADVSRILVFTGCPHRSTSYLDMEDSLCRFLFDPSGKGASRLTLPSVSSIAGLAAAIIEVNSLFVDCKAILRCRLVSVHAGTPPSDDEDAQKRIARVFNSYSGTLGVPFEKRFVVVGSEASDLTRYLDELNSILNNVYDGDTVLLERKLLSVASSIDPFRSGRDRNAPVTKTSAYKTWLDLPGPQILYIHGSHGVRDAAEQVFYALDERKTEKGTIVLYFSFDQWDIRRNSIRDMASTFLAQVNCQFAHNQDWARNFSALLDFTKGWTEADLVYWLERLRFSHKFEQAIYVINYFDDCTKGSRKAFFDKFKYLAAVSEKQWKVVVTSHKPGALLSDLPDTALTTLDLSTSASLPNSGPDIEEKIKRLTQVRPELLLQHDLVRKELREIAEIDPLAQQIVLEQAQAQLDWPHSLSIRKLVEPLELVKNGQWDDRYLASFLDRLLRGIPGEVVSLRVFLSWLLYTVRPLTVWELGTALCLGSDVDKGLASPPLSALEGLTRKIQLWFAGIVEVDQNEVRISHPRLRNILMGKGSLEGKRGEERSPRYLWDDIADTAHYDIARLCLDYLSRPSVRDIIDNTCRVSETSGVHIFADRGNLCSYALQAWTHHFLQASSANRTKLGAQFASSPLGRDWARGYWALSNPITRSKITLDSLFPIFAGLGLCEVVKPRDAQDMSRGLLEAASKRQFQTVKRLLRRNKFPEATLLDALVAAGASGDEQLMLDLVQHISSRSDDPDSVAWPPSLIYRASWLGMDRLAERLLQLGVPPDPGVPWLDIVKESPLVQAVRNFHVGTTRALVSHGANVALVTSYSYGRIPLHLVTQFGNVEITRLLVQEGKSNIEAKDERNFSPLLFACLCGHYGVVKELLRMGADPNMGVTAGSTVNSWTPLIVAAQSGFEKCVKLLLENMVEVNLDGPTKAGTALRYAVTKGHVNICRILLEAGANPNSPLIRPPLIVQLPMYLGQDKKEPRRNILELLFDNGIDVNARDADEVATIVRLLDWKDIDPFYELVLNHGVDVNALDSEGKGPLYHAVLKNKPTLVKLLLARGAEVNRISTDGAPPIYHAMPNVDITRTLLEAGADPSLGKINGYTSLMYAAWFETNLESLKLMLKHNVALEDVYDKEGNYNGWTALTCAASNGYAAAVRLLAEDGANLQHLGRDGIPILHFAAKAEAQPTEKLAALLEFLARLDINQTDKEGQTALHLADVHLPNVTRLVNVGAAVNIQDKMGCTPLANHAYCNNTDIVKLLLKHGADPNIASPYWGGPLHRAGRSSNLDMVKLLVKNGGAGVDINLPSSGMLGTPLTATCLHYEHDDSDPADNSADIVRYLVDRGADVNARCGLVGYALNAAALTSGPAIIDLLLEKGARVDVRDGTGRTPVHFSAFNSVDVFQRVIDAGCDFAARDENGRTSLMWAAQSGQVEVTEKILSMISDEDVDVKDRDGWTALCWAARGPGCWRAGQPVSRLVSVMKMLLEHGAEKDVVATTADGRRWTPLKIARYHGAVAEVVELLESEDEKGRPDDESKLATWHDNTCCDSCLADVFGIQYACKTCDLYALCFKCYPYREQLHPLAYHEFEEKGPEYVEVNWENREDSEETSSNTSSDTDSSSELEVDEDDEQA